MTKVAIGEWEDGGAASFDLTRLLVSRLLIQAGSGGGKSYLLRRILEQTTGHVQQFVIDSEGEFASLRERHDYVIAAVTGGDALAHPRTAGLLLRRLMETGVSAILDISELQKRERRSCVKLFLEEMMQLPRAMWSPVLVALDEAHEFAPEKDEAESLAAVVDLATRGRKRGFCLVAATQRIGKLAKDVAAELHNKLVGFTSLDIDVKRAAFELGMGAREANAALSVLKPGEFYGYGRALSPTVRKLAVGEVFTTHPEPGERKLRAPPKPTDAIKSILPKLADLPQEAEEEARTVADLKRELATVRRELTQAQRAQPKPASPSPEQLKAAEQRGHDRGWRECTKAATELAKATERRLAESVRAAFSEMRPGTPPEIGARPENPERRVATHRPAEAVMERRTGTALTVPRSHRQIDGRAPTDGTLSKAERAILGAIAQFPEGISNSKAAILSGYSVTSSHFANSLSGLRTKGFIGSRQPLAATSEGIEALGSNHRPLPSGHELREMWLNRLGKAERALFIAVLDAGRPLTRKELSEATGYSDTSSHFANSLSKLRTLELISGSGEVRANEDLFT